MNIQNNQKLIAEFERKLQQFCLLHAHPGPREISRREPLDSKAIGFHLWTNADMLNSASSSVTAAREINPLVPHFERKRCLHGAGPGMRTSR
jgi:hypothetical protein